MPKNSSPRFIVTPFLPKELAELLKVPIDTLIASYRKPSPTTPNSKGKKKKKKKSGAGAGALQSEPVVDKAAIAAAAQELLSSSVVHSYQPPISEGYDPLPSLQPLDNEVLLPLPTPSIPSSKRHPTRVTVEEVPDENQATNATPAPALETPRTPCPKLPTSQVAAPPPGQPYLDYTGLPRLPPFDTYPPPSMDFLQSEAFRSFKADRLRRMYKDEINATFASDGRFNPQPGSIVYKLLEEMRGVKSRDTRDEQRRREEEKHQQEQQTPWPTDAAEDEGGCWCSKCGCRTGQYGDDSEGIVSQP